ncbi:PAS domain S-box protein [Phormidium sp. LEGE 05292]|uniref:sensor domain-containing diguanylate cyclase n=1 Tax=[Phormidium] sp. LEGE 05292 TaxID=767427 RepID=UPI0018806B79|nr:PAS domain S-box protein [Phormidium sp. LEGE 05292]MBE9226787.1 PAS domain S-box protein [Phormidium sp. LEGE 05292]
MSFINRVNERKIAESVVKERKLSVESLINNIPGAIYRRLYDSYWTMEFISDAIADIAGYSALDFIDNQIRSFASIIYPIDREIIEQSIYKSINCKKPYILEYRIIHANGSIKWVYEKGQAILANLGDVEYLDGAIFDITDRKIAELSLQESEYRYYTLTKTSPVGIFRLDLQGNCLYANQKWCEIAGITLEEALEKDWITTIYSDDRERFFQEFNLVTSNKTSFKLEFRLQRSDSKIIWVLGQIVAEKDSEGKILGYVGSLTDISENKQIEEELRYREAKIKALLDAIPDLVICLKKDGTLLEHQTGKNSSMPLLSDMKVGNNIYTILPARLGQQFMINIEKTLNTKEMQTWEYQILIHGNWRFRECRMMASGKDEVIAIIRDVTESKIVEIALHEHQKELKTLIENVPDIIARFDRQLRHLYANTAVEKVTGMAPKVFLGKTNRELGMPRQLVNYWEKCMEYVFAKGKASEIEFEYNTPTGIRYYHARIVPEFSEQGAVETILAVTRDVTKQKLTEKALEQSEQKFSLHIQNSPVAVIEYNLNFTIVEWNPAAEKIFGYTKNEIIGYPGWRLIPENERALVGEIWHNLLNQTGGYRSTNKNITKDGKIIICEWYNTPLIAENGDYIGVTCLAEDITDRVQAELSLRQQIEREKLLLTITQRIHESLNLEEILNTGVREVRELINSDRVLIYRIWADGTGCVVTEAVVPDCETILGRTFPVEVFPLEYHRLYSQGRFYAMSDRDSAKIPACLVEFLYELSVRAKLVVPLMAGENLWGLLIAHHCRDVRDWQPSEISLLQQLATQLGIAIQQALLVEQMELANAELKRLACLDGLTQVANRRHFNEYLEREWRRMIREQNPIALILCDIDYFKLYNDTYGHLAGDSCLQQVADAIQRAVQRPADLVARYGGEEFAVILPNTNTEGALTVAEKIRTYVAALQISHQESQTSKYVTLSLGVAVTIPCLEFSYQELIRRADLGLYEAKSQGRDRIILKSFG